VVLCAVLCCAVLCCHHDDPLKINVKRILLELAKLINKENPCG